MYDKTFTNFRFLYFCGAFLAYTNQHATQKNSVGLHNEESNTAFKNKNGLPISVKKLIMAHFISNTAADTGPRATTSLLPVL